MPSKPSPSPAPILNLLGRRAPSQRQVLDVHPTAGRLVSELATLRAGLERADLPDADPDRSPGDIPRAEVIEAAISAAEVAAISLRVGLDVVGANLGAVERLQIDARAAEAMLVLLGREFDRAPWGLDEARSGLIVELIRSATDAARRVRVGLGQLAESQAVARG